MRGAMFGLAVSLGMWLVTGAIVAAVMLVLH